MTIVKLTVLSAILMLTQAVYGASVTKPALEDLEHQYLYTLTNFALRAHDPAVFGDWLDSFRKDKDYSQEAMAKALVSIAERGIASTNLIDLRMANASINAMEYLRLTNTLPKLKEWTLHEGQLAISAFNAYGEITGHDDRYIELGKNAVNSHTLTENFVMGQMTLLLHPLDQEAMAQFGLHCQPLQEKARLKITRIVLNRKEWNFESCMGKEEMLSRTLDNYTNSIEHLRSQRRINEYLLQDKDFISKKSYYRITGDNRKLSDEEWYFRATNVCQTEIARVMALPEEERLNMTAILDAQIAAIEEEEARAARRAVWRRRLRIGAVSLLTLAVVFAIVRRIRQSGHARVRRQHAA